MDLAKIFWWIGFLSAGSAFIPMNVVLRRLKGLGYKTGPFENWRSPGTFERDVREYLRIRHEHGWSAWPLHLVWIMVLLGFVLLVVGTFF